MFKKKVLKTGACGLVMSMLLNPMAAFAEEEQNIYEGLPSGGSIETFDLNIFNDVTAVEKHDDYYGYVEGATVHYADENVGYMTLPDNSELSMQTSSLSGMSFDEIVNEYENFRTEYYDMAIAKGALEMSDSAYQNDVSFNFLKGYRTYSYTNIEDYYKEIYQFTDFHLDESGNYVYTNFNGDEVIYDGIDIEYAIKDLERDGEIAGEIYGMLYSGSNTNSFTLSSYDYQWKTKTLGMATYKLLPKNCIVNGDYDIVEESIFEMGASGGTTGTPPTVIVYDQDDFNQDDYFIEFTTYDAEMNRTRYAYDGEWKAFLIVNGKISEKYVAGETNYILAFYQPAINPVRPKRMLSKEYIDNNGYAEERFIQNTNLGTCAMMFAVYPKQKKEVVVPVEEVIEPEEPTTIIDEPVPNIDIPVPVVIIPVAALLLLLLFRRKKIIFHGALTSEGDSAFFVTTFESTKENREKPETIQDIIDRLVADENMEYDTLIQEIVGSGYITKVPKRTKITVITENEEKEIKTSERALFKELQQAALSHVLLTVVFYDKKTGMTAEIQYDFR